MFKYVHVRCNCEILHHKWFLGTIKCFKGYKNMFLVKSLAVSPYYRLTFMKDLQSVISQKSSQVCASQYIQKFSIYIYMRFPENRPNYLIILYKEMRFFGWLWTRWPLLTPTPLCITHIVKKIICNQIFFIGGRGRGHFF